MSCFTVFYARLGYAAREGPTNLCMKRACKSLILLNKYMYCLRKEEIFSLELNYVENVTNRQKILAMKVIKQYVVPGQNIDNKRSPNSLMLKL